MNRYKIDKNIEYTIYRWASFEAGCETIWSMQDTYHQQVPTPELPFVMLGIVGGPETIGGSNQRILDDKFIYITHKAITIQIDVFSQNGHLEIAQRIADSLHTDLVRSYFAANGIGILGASTITDTSELQETEYRRRATFEVRLGFTSTIEEKISDDIVGPYGKVSSIDNIEEKFDYGEYSGNIEIKR